MALGVINCNMWLHCEYSFQLICSWLLSVNMLKLKTIYYYELITTKIWKKQGTVRIFQVHIFQILSEASGCVNASGYIDRGAGKIKMGCGAS